MFCFSGEGAFVPRLFNHREDGDHWQDEEEVVVVEDKLQDNSGP